MSEKRKEYDYSTGEKLAAIMEEYGCNIYKARYILGAQRTGRPYKPHQGHCKGYDYETFKDFDVNKHKWHSKNGYQGLYTNIGRGKEISLASIVWMQYHKRNIPAGHVINHIDENPLNNAIDNLELIPIGENTSKNKKSSRNNQYSRTGSVLSRLRREKEEAFERKLEDPTEQNIRAWREAIARLKEYQIECHKEKRGDDDND